MFKKVLTLGLFVFASLTISQVVGGSAYAHDGEDHGAKTVAATTNDSYHYTAQAGDSYTKIARKAVQTYGIKTGTKLSPAQIIFAENGLTADAGNIELNLGQNVDIKKSLVGSWIEKAKKLTTEQKAAWTTFVPFVDFNTNNVGEKR